MITEQSLKRNEKIANEQERCGQTKMNKKVAGRIFCAACFKPQNREAGKSRGDSADFKGTWETPLPLDWTRNRVD
jgi:hypothetical protein